MTYDELISYYESPAAAAAARGIDRQVVHGWKQRGRVPLDHQCEFEVLTEGVLRADIPHKLRATLPKRGMRAGDQQ